MKFRMHAEGRVRRVPAAVVAAAALVLSGCGVGGGSTAEQTADSKTLTVVVEGGGKAELQPVADLYQKETGTEVKPSSSRTPASMTGCRRS